MTFIAGNEEFVNNMNELMTEGNLEVFDIIKDNNGVDYNSELMRMGNLSSNIKSVNEYDLATEITLYRSCYFIHKPNYSDGDIKIEFKDIYNKILVENDDWGMCSLDNNEDYLLYIWISEDEEYEINIKNIDSNDYYIQVVI